MMMRIRDRAAFVLLQNNCPNETSRIGIDHNPFTPSLTNNGCCVQRDVLWSWKRHNACAIKLPQFGQDHGEGNLEPKTLNHGKHGEHGT